MASARTEPGREVASWAVDRIRCGDGRRLRAVRLEFLREAPWRASPLREAERWPLQEWEEQSVRGATADDVATFVAREGGEWLGVVDGVATDPVTVDVANFWVRPADRGRGIGRALLAAVEAWARRRGASRLALWVVETNDAAVDFYRRAGFEGFETRPVQSIPGLRQARMVRRLGGPESRTSRPSATQAGGGNG